MERKGLITVAVWIMVFRVAETLYCYSCKDLLSNDDCYNVTECKTNETCYGTAQGLPTGEVKHTLGCTDRQAPTTALPGRFIFCDQHCTSNFCNLHLCSAQGNVNGPIRCLSCPFIKSPTECQTVKSCALDEVCFLKRFETFGVNRYRMGCMKKQFCAHQRMASVANIIGRRNTNASDHCSVCCSGHHCNAVACNTQGSGHGNITKLLDLTDTCSDRNPAACHAFALLSLDACSHPEVVPMCPKSCGTCGHVGWSAWSPWSGCSKTCGNGTSTRFRKCLHQIDMTVNQTCIGQPSAQKECMDKHCPVNGQWSLWSPWSGCSVTCDIGTQKRNRHCNNPVPAYGGDVCKGSNEETRSCNTTHCPVNGQWSSWSPWTDCSVTCGSGTYKRFRYCNNPQPAHGGRTCQGDNQFSQSCIRSHCPINGGMCAPSNCHDEFHYYHGHSTVCDSGSCDCPAPAYGGKPCS